VERPAGWLEIDLDGLRAGSPRLGGQARRRVDLAARPDGREKIGGLDGPGDTVHVVGNFTEPHDVGPGGRHGAVGAEVCGLHHCRCVPARAAGSAERAQDFSMHVDDPKRTRPLVQIVDILGHQREVDTLTPPERREGVMRGVRHGMKRVLPARVIEAMDLRGVAREALGGRDLFERVVRPEPARVAECAETAFRGDAGACENDESHATKEVLPNGFRKPPGTARAFRPEAATGPELSGHPDSNR